MNIKVLGAGCKSCEALLNSTKEAVASKGIDTEVEYITDMEKIMSYGVMSMPALVIELKWNNSAETAIQQIKNRNYPAALKDYGGDILLVGISYNKDAPVDQRKYSCRIEKVAA